MTWPNEYTAYERRSMAASLSRLIKEAFNDPETERGFQEWLRQKKECTLGKLNQCTR